MAATGWASRLAGSVMKPFAGGSRQAGDAARDERRWREAAHHYAEHLRTHRDDFGAWVQRGNCAKEAGDFDEALAAYHEAVALDGTDADVQLQRGHCLKLMGWRSGAIQAYRRSLELRETGNPALMELLRLGGQAEVRGALDARGGPLPAAAVPTIHVDFTDLVVYLRHNASMSGIQRVVANLLRHAGAVARDARDRCRIVPVLPDYHRLEVAGVDPALVRALLEAVDARAERAVIDAALDAVEAGRRRVRPVAGDVLVIPGAFWIYRRYDLLDHLRRGGVQVSVYIHDLIQVTNPEFVARDATNDFLRSLVDVVSVASLVLTNSRFVQGEVRRYLASRLDVAVPVEAVTLATELGPSGPPATPGDGEVAHLATTEFVLFVSTIEVRKNHGYLLAIWERLLRDYEGAVPNLVFVGKWGWQVEALTAYLDRSDHLGGRLFILNGIADGDLAALYDACLFTMYPSLAEGWGLPVGESLAHGKPCIASRHTAIPEVGGSLCRYIDPLDVDDGYAAVVRVLADRADLAAWQARIRDRFRPKSWAAFAAEFYGALLARPAGGTPAPALNNCRLAPEQIATFGDASLIQLGAGGGRIVSARMFRLGGWHALEGWGCWAARRRAELAIATLEAPGTAVVLALCLTAPSEERAADCTVRIGADARRLEGLGRMPRWYTVPGVVASDGTLAVAVIAGRGFSRGEDGVERYVGILALGYARAADPQSRLRLCEAIVPGVLAAA